MNSLSKHIPNFLTCLNLVSGCFGIIYSFESLSIASACIFLSCIFDFFDGFVARALRASSPIGKELDSLADVVSFGVLPGIILYHLFFPALLATELFSPEMIKAIPFLSLLIPVFSALRLAKFNIDTRQTEDFIGLPTPANAILFASLPLILAQHELPFFPPFILIGMAVIMPALLVSNLRLFGLKFKSFGLKDNFLKYLFLLVAVILLLTLTYSAIPLIIAMYLIVSPIHFFVKKASGNQ